MFIQLSKKASELPEETLEKAFCELKELSSSLEDNSTLSLCEGELLALKCNDFKFFLKTFYE